MTAPALSSYGPLHTILEPGGTGAWDEYLETMVDLIKFNDVYYLYYSGYSEVRPDDGPGYRAIGVATSTDLLNWTKYSGNPVLTYLPNVTNPYEGTETAGFIVDGSTIHCYYNAYDAHGQGGDVDSTVRYKNSTDGFTFSNDQNILDQGAGIELYVLAAYKEPAGDYHVYCMGPAAGGFGEIFRLSGTTATNVTANGGQVGTVEPYGIGNIIDLDGSTLLLNLTYPWGTSLQYPILKSSLGDLETLDQTLEFEAQRYGPATIWKEGSQWYLFQIIWDSYTEPYGEGKMVMRASPDIPAFALADSANIAASASTDTTAQLTAPGGKTTGDFQAGKISDDTNPFPAIDLGEDTYTEIESCIEATAAALVDSVYEFRITDNGTDLDTYTLYPEWTIEAGMTNINTTESIAVLVNDAIEGFIAGQVAESLAVGFAESTQGVIDGNLDESIPIDLSEATQFSNTINVVDGHSISMTEQAALTPFGMILVSGVENIPINLSEATLHFNAGSIEEVIGVLFGEGSSVVDITGGPTVKIGSESIGILFEESNSMVVDGQLAESIPVALTEATQFYIDFITAESISIVLLESASAEDTLGLPISVVGSESIGVHFTEAVQFLNSLNQADTIPIALLESSTLTLFGVLHVSGSETLPVYVTEQTQFSNTLAGQETIQLAVLETMNGVIAGTVIISTSEDIQILMTELVSLNTGIQLGKIILASAVDINPNFTAVSLQSIYEAVKTT